jgi:hypothetical protein
MAPRVYHKSFELYIFGLATMQWTWTSHLKALPAEPLGGDTDTLARVGYTFRTLRDRASSMKIV